jgi:hypothetical protein
MILSNLGDGVLRPQLSTCHRREQESKVKPTALLSFSFFTQPRTALRKVNATKQTLAPDIIAKRTKRHLDELEVNSSSPVLSPHP